MEENLAAQPAVLVEVATVLLHLLEPRLAAAEVDLVSDADDLPPLVRESGATLRSRGGANRSAKKA